METKASPDLRALIRIPPGAVVTAPRNGIMLLVTDSRKFKDGSERIAMVKLNGGIGVNKIFWFSPTELFRIHLSHLTGL